MKVAAVADLHGALPEVPPCDALLIAGDICPDFLTDSMSLDKSGHLQANWLSTAFRAWLDEVPAERIIGIGGNHDFVLERPSLVPDGLRWEYLMAGDEVLVGGLRVWAQPFVPNLPFWAYHADAVRLRKLWNMLPVDVDIVLSHGPPYGAGDKCGPGARDEGKHVGDAAFDGVLRARGPMTVVCGHIHGGFGRYEHSSGSVVYNVAHVDEAYKPTRAPTILDF